MTHLNKILLTCLALVCLGTSLLRAEEASSQKPKDSRPRKYFTDTSPRQDAGVFHVGFAGGGNYYMEPEFDYITHTYTGNQTSDFGFEVGVYFDYDYSELDENIPLMLRGMVGYKYVLSSVHVFTFDGMVRKMFRFSQNASFGLGFGASAAFWQRTDNPPYSIGETIFLPSLLVGAGFEFNPFMVDFKTLINRLGPDNTTIGFELLFGFRL